MVTVDSEIVPLVRPSFPSYLDFGQRWSLATGRTGQFSNFGVLFDEAQERLSSLTGRYAIPVSTGTAAVELAIAAAEASYGHGVDIAFEAFTFQATHLAAEHVSEVRRGHGDGYVFPIRTNQSVARGGKGELGVVVRTIPFGMGRDWSHNDDRCQLVIDAAGAFDPITIRELPERAFIACSFHATKSYPIGEGGCVFLPKGTSWAAKTIQAAMNFGFDSKRNVLRGWATNAKLDELRCSILIEQLERVGYFTERSRRIREHVKAIVQSPGTRTWAPYALGYSQSLVVVAHADPAKLVTALFEAGFIARRVYHPFISADHLTYDEQRLVALPSDMTDDELHNLIVAMRKI